MSAISRIVKNATVLFAARILVRILGLVLVIYMTHFLGAVGFGKYSFAVAFTSTFTMIAYFGLDQVLIRGVARDKSAAGKYLGNMSIIKFILSVIAFLLIVFMIDLMNYPPDTTYVVYIIGLYAMLVSFAEFFRSIFLAFEKMEYDAIMSIIEVLVILFLGLFVLFSGYGLIELAFCFLIGGLVNLLLSFLICINKFAKPKIEIDLEFWKYSIKESLPFAINAIFVSIFLQIAVIMLSIMKGDADTGIYSASFKLLAALLIVPVVMNNSLFPIMSQLFVSSKDNLMFSIKKSMKYIFIIGLPISIGVALLADKIILILFGEEFAASIIVLQILVWFIPLRFMTSVLETGLASISRQWFNTLSTLLCVIFNISLNLTLIPKFSFKGAAITTLLTEILLFLLVLYFVRKYLYKKLLSEVLSKDYIKIILSGLVMGGFIYHVRGMNFVGIEIIDLIILITLSASIYFATLYLVKGFSKKDQYILKRVISRK